jgi:hypothetical protein
MGKQTPINVELMFNNLLAQANALIAQISKMDPTSEAYGVLLNNLAKTFTILAGSNVKPNGDKDGDK